MHCWEFHHQVEDGDYRWYWRAVHADGTLHSESAERFETSIAAFDDAKKHGFDRELHEWYMAPAGKRPCVKAVNGG